MPKTGIGCFVEKLTIRCFPLILLLLPSVFCFTNNNLIPYRVECRSEFRITYISWVAFQLLFPCLANRDGLVTMILNATASGS